ncbi:glycoside hydrolase family 5 protein [Paenibacillus spongiae]|uniref:Glycoside hydrolase family 5 protein n=1 Tax=Paenibacillus spongiae TaxID=2909671 RepID=A0ABY5SKB0_9BACL|nr:glycoside hydrolase family 5 protein [Paenibacillus spongiae]UVI33033.1 glycoside hydrolase family 5 protein [Paenibacillus spongiae]
MSTPIRIHPDNPKLFEFRGKPLVLLCATEHYGAVMNRPFDYASYLKDAYDKQQTLTRLFVLFRELQSAMNPYSTCKPESPDYIAPFARSGQGKALDGQPLYDLDQWNPEFFERLHGFMSMAAEYGIVVELVLLSNTYGPDVWALNPLNAKNNTNGTEEIEWPDYMSLRHPQLRRRQLDHVRKIVEETNKYDNLIYEICNEPGGAVAADARNPAPSEVNEWQAEIARTIRDTEARLPNKHLIVGQEAFTYTPWEQSSDLSFRGELFDTVNIHPLPNTTYDGKAYHMGEFMSKQLKLRPFRDYCLAVYGERKPLNMDEDNIASQYKDPDGWTIHRKRAWTALLSGAHYDVIDFSIINYCPTGTPQSQQHLRSWMRNLSAFVHSIDLLNARPLSSLVTRAPEHVLEIVFGVEGKDIAIYLADERELNEGTGEPVRGGKLALALPQSEYSAVFYSPVSGLYSPAVTVRGGDLVLDLPEFQHDVLVRLTLIA